MHITSNQSVNLMIALVNVILLFGVWLGFFAFEAGWVGATIVYFCIGLGIKTLYDIYNQQSLELPEYSSDPSLQTFLRKTRKLWLSPPFRQFYDEAVLQPIRSQTSAKFVYDMRPIKGNPLAIFLKQHGPLREGEVMIGFGDLGEIYKPEPYFVLTNMRWFQKIGEPDQVSWALVELEDLSSFAFDVGDYGTATLHLRSGEIRTWEGLGFFPKDELLVYGIENVGRC